MQSVFRGDYKFLVVFVACLEVNAECIVLFRAYLEMIRLSIIPSLIN